MESPVQPAIPFGQEGFKLPKKPETKQSVPKTPSKKELIRLAREALLGTARSSAYLKDLYQKLEAVDQFDYASELLLIRINQDRAAGKKPSLSDYQTLVKYIYKDDSLSSDFKYDRAIHELDAADSLVSSGNCESLGLAGAIYKRKWQSDHQFCHLALALYYYDRGFRLWKQYISDGGSLGVSHDRNDEGWNAINYAYVLELETIDRLEETGAITGFQHFDTIGFLKAQETRKYILEQFLHEPFSDPKLKNPGCPPWVLATIAEAYFGLSLYDYAVNFINQYKSQYLQEPWELRTFSQQIFSLAYLQQTRDKMTRSNASVLRFRTITEAGVIDQDKVNDCLSALDIKNEADINVDTHGKMGLAFSGGGFRASLFHIGVLAALAERDELKNVEVISCVSGGSIIGAYYYLKLKLLLEERDDAVVREDYIRLVGEIETDFLKGVQKNLRMRIFSRLPANFKMLDKDYSRTNRLGELYDEHLYKPILEAHVAKLKKAAKESGTEYVPGKYDELVGQNARPIYMTDLFITPNENFVMDTDNWKRKNKVPQLVLNATSVNTGHNWQFTASWMGEPAADITHDIDVKSRLRRMYYYDAPDTYKNFRLGYAVGASSCVPVMFEPLPMNDLYPGIELQLIDGGLHDNQGIACILDEECKNVFISDASGQLPTTNESVSNLVSLFMRADNILQERLRELQFLDMKERKNTTLINRLHEVHLKNGINAVSVNWKNCSDPPRTISYVDPNVKDKSLLPYGVLRDVQQQISEIRTDLDAFHDVEAYALMYDGYTQTHYALSDEDPAGFTPEVNEGWKFLGIREYLTDPAKAEQVKSLLSISSKVPFKVYELLGGKRLGYAILAILAMAILIPVWIYREPIFGEHTFSGLSIAIAAAVFIAGLIWKPAGIALNPKGYLQKVAWRLGLAVLAFVVFAGYLRFFNGIYLKKGKLPPPTKV